MLYHSGLGEGKEKIEREGNPTSRKSDEKWGTHREAGSARNGVSTR
jgi:hypothetical protein